MLKKNLVSFSTIKSRVSLGTSNKKKPEEEEAEALPTETERSSTGADNGGDGDGKQDPGDIATSAGAGGETTDEPAGASAGTAGPDEWQCPRCTFINMGDTEMCSVCMGRRPGS